MFKFPVVVINPKGANIYRMEEIVAVIPFGSVTMINHEYPNEKACVVEMFGITEDELGGGLEVLRDDVANFGFKI